MAHEENPKDLKLLKNTKISVFVDEALPDILVVTYEFGVKMFKGVLLDSTKSRHLPYGVHNLNPVFHVSPKEKVNPDDDVLYSVSQRYAYNDPSKAKKRSIQIPSKYKNNRMTVRLRPRQVLCSKCKGICNENSENVSRKRKSPESVQLPPVGKRSLNAPVTRSVSIYSVLNKKSKNQESTLIPKLTRLTVEEESMASNCIDKNIHNNRQKKPLLTLQSNSENTRNEDSQHSFVHSEDSSNSDESRVNNNRTSANTDSDSKSSKRILRKKRSVGSMEDLWDETVFEESASKNKDDVHNSVNTEQSLTSNSLSTNTKTIKISYGPQGEGTVLKIPAQIENLNTVSKNAEENIDYSVQGNKNRGSGNDDKATRKAMKKAKREAKKKILLSGSSSCYMGSGSSPRYIFGGSSPRYTIGSASPRHGLGNNSPRYLYNSCDINVSRRRKHKMKHKKKHRDEKDKKPKEGEIIEAEEHSKEQQNVTQKLSINLKRLNNTYTSYTTSFDQSEDMSSSDEHSEKVPDFPPANQPLILRINSQTLTSALGANGDHLLVGDVVWGKIHGFPWWPGKVLTITNCENQSPQAHVAWYGSSTSSLMQCDQLSPYLEYFKVRYNKKKRGPYKEAIKQATTEARENADNRMDQLIESSPSRTIMNQVVAPALASPREIDVMS